MKSKLMIEPKLSPDEKRPRSGRLDEGRAPKTINGEISVLRQVLKHARLWYRFREDYKPIPNTKPPSGRALTEDEQGKVVRSRSKPF